MQLHISGVPLCLSLTEYPMAKAIKVSRHAEHPHELRLRWQSSKQTSSPSKYPDDFTALREAQGPGSLERKVPARLAFVFHSFLHTTAFYRQLQRQFSGDSKAFRTEDISQRPATAGQQAQGPPRAADANLTPTDTPTTQCNFLTPTQDGQHPEYDRPHFPTPPPLATTPPGPRKTSPPNGNPK